MKTLCSFNIEHSISLPVDTKCKWNVHETFRRHPCSEGLMHFNPLSANLTKWSNTLKQFVGTLKVKPLQIFLKDKFFWKSYYVRSIYNLCSGGGGGGGVTGVTVIETIDLSMLIFGNKHFYVFCWRWYFLIHPFQCILFLPSENIRKPYGFLMFSGSRERVHWEWMG